MADVCCQCVEEAGYISCLNRLTSITFPSDAPPQSVLIVQTTQISSRSTTMGGARSRRGGGEYLVSILSLISRNVSIVRLSDSSTSGLIVSNSPIICFATLSPRRKIALGEKSR